MSKCGVRDCWRFLAIMLVLLIVFDGIKLDLCLLVPLMMEPLFYGNTEERNICQLLKNLNLENLAKKMQMISLINKKKA